MDFKLNQDRKIQKNTFTSENKYKILYQRQTNSILANLSNLAMIIPLNDIILIYEKMQQQLNVEYVSVLIFTGTDIDSLCSLKILTRFLKSESIHFNFYPVVNYTDLQTKIQQARFYEQVKLFLFINCGGVIDLTEKWFITNNGNLSTQNSNQEYHIPRNSVILFDVNKPLHHKNIQCKYIMIVDDQHSELDKRVTSDDFKKLQELQEFDLDEDFNGGSQSEDQDENQGENGNQRSRKRRNQKILMQKLRKKKLHLEEKVNEYYHNSFYGLPSSYSIYKLIRQLNKANNYSLWFAIVGMTSMFLQNNISKDALENLTGFYRSDVVKLNPQNMQKRERGEIYTKKGYQFPLLNHWSLYESMMNSPYLMTKLSLWNDKGIKTLHQILTKIGISLNESKQHYKYMLKQSKQALQEKIFAVAEDYDLIDITYESFMKQTDSSSAYMASDYYFMLLAILQRPYYHIKIGVKHNNQGAQTNNQAFDNFNSTPKQNNQSSLNQHRVNCFLDAYSCIDGSQQMLFKQVENYKKMSSTIMKQVRDVIERDNIISMKKLHFCNFRCDNKEKKLFEHYNTLMRFAYLLLGIQKQRKYGFRKEKEKGKKQLPFIVSLQDADTNLCTIVGVVSDFKSKLCAQFQFVTSFLELEQVNQDKFNSNVIMLKKQNLLDFIRKVDDLLMNKKLQRA